jgi:Na+-driven multidrug efflux pump
MEIKMLKLKMKNAFYSVCAATLMLPFQMSQAAVVANDGIAGSLDSLTTAGKSGVNLVFIASALIGVGLMVAGGLQLKKYADNPQQNGIAKPMIYLLAGVLVFSVVATSETMEQTLFGASDGTKAMDLDSL